MGVKKVWKDDLEKFLSEAVGEFFKLKSDDYEIHVNSLYSFITIKTGKISKFDFANKAKDNHAFESYLEKTTFSNVKVSQYCETWTGSEYFVTCIKLAVNYEIIYN